MPRGGPRCASGRVSTGPRHARGVAGRARLWGVAAVALAGCRGEPEGFDRYIPAPAVAEAALVAVLEGWRDGRPPETLAARKPAVCVLDKQRKPGQRLARFELLGEVSTDAARGFAVRLSLENPAQQHVARFLVAGIDPLWVFRQEDYEMISHWMHPMDDPAQDAATPNPPGATP